MDIILLPMICMLLTYIIIHIIKSTLQSIGRYVQFNKRYLPRINHIQSTSVKFVESVFNNCCIHKINKHQTYKIRHLCRTNGTSKYYTRGTTANKKVPRSYKPYLLMATILVNSTPMYSTKDEITYTYNQASTYVDDQDSCWAMHYRPRVHHEPKTEYRLHLSIQTPILLASTPLPVSV